MKVCAAGLWHLGCVMAAGLTTAGHEDVFNGKRESDT